MQLDQGKKLTSRKSESKKHMHSNGVKIATALASASCSLLSANTFAKGESGTWDFDTAVLVYSESDSRVQAAEPVISATRNYDGDKKLNLKFVFDSLTGASPSGATSSLDVQTFTSPSGKKEYQIAAGEPALDTSFKDSRVALSANWSAPINEDWAYSTGIYLSREYDYQSLGLNGIVTRYLNSKNTELNMGLSVNADSSDPVGGKPVGLSRMMLSDSTLGVEEKGGSETKSVVDLLFGVTQVINKSTLIQLSYSLSNVSGYQSDPYKILSVIDDQDGANYGSNYKGLDAESVYLYENRPDKRTKHAVYARSKKMFSGKHVLDTSYRIMTDDWGVSSHTLDFKFRWQLANSYLEPHLRFYQQSEADFYRRYINSSEYTGGMTDIAEASSDERLSKLTGTTVGLKYGFDVANGKEASVRIELYQQSHDGDALYGKLLETEQYPDLTAMTLILGYSF